MAQSPPQLAFTSEDARLAITDILTSFKMPENVLRLEEARGNAGNDMLKVMQVVFPLVTQLQMDIIPKYGFTGDGDGIIRFAQTIKHLERQDPVLAELNAELRSVVMPQMAAPAPKAGMSS